MFFAMSVLSALITLIIWATCSSIKLDRGAVVTVVTGMCGQRAGAARAMVPKLLRGSTGIFVVSALTPRPTSLHLTTRTGGMKW